MIESRCADIETIATNLIPADELMVPIENPGRLMNRTKVIALVCSAVFAAILGGCGGSNAGNASIGGTVTGLAAGATVSLSNNNGTSILVPNGNFTFSGTIASGDGYNVAVTAQPAGQTCQVTYGSGVINYAGTDVTNVTVNCTANVPIGVSVTGLDTINTVTFDLILQNNPNNPLNSKLQVTGVGNGTVTGNFVGTLLPLTTVYAITVETQPTNPVQVCSFAPTPAAPSSASGGVVSNAAIVVGVTCK